MENKISWEQTEVMRLLQSQPGTVYQESNVAERAEIRKWIRDVASKSIITVTFEKSDGSIREMKCTLDTDHMPAYTAPAMAEIDMFHSLKGAVAATRSKPVKLTESDEPKEDSSLKVFDLEALAWRSFRYDRLKNISVELSFQ
jgi:hypothetical protein